MSEEFGYIYANVNCPAIKNMRRILEAEGEAPSVFPKWCESIIEKNSHCTIYYGLCSDMTFEKDSNYERLKMFFGEHPRTYFVPALATVFRNTWWDCLVVSAAPGIYRQCLEIMHKAFEERFFDISFEDDTNDGKYIPHITVGYVKAGSGHKFIDRFNSIYEGRMPMRIDSVIVELANGNSKTFELGRM